ncbi:MAG: TetR/AcrR family transcriptional regulator [Thiofilum sp.]|uniref:TetR/AcrR family transcriptional regulator n=1 Tax=Thiofilum sp. TaxID=2212733 RepID=UPI0025D8018F|nr:TetR/AcrR family transcriptional regulator [Thiofilum sp.]MBK8454228.1 TetR family transcriptional regulator C-terminal domain-containing protein [Thiofilum sp.]
MPIISNTPSKVVGRIRKFNEAKILQAAELEFAEHGYKGASINNIAQRAKLAKANIHYYFGSKQELYLKVLETTLKLWDQTLNDFKPEDDPALVLSTYIRQKITFAQSNPFASRIFAKEILSGAPELKAYLNKDYYEWFQGRVAVIESWIAQGKILPINPTHLIFLLWSSTQHYADFETQILAAQGKRKLTQKDYDTASQTLTEVILRGCGLTIPRL